MGLFSRKQEMIVCEMCGKADADGCGLAYNHIQEVRGDQPAWLPAHLRVQAQGEYTWLCVRCNSFPAMKWPRDSGAVAGMMGHLGTEHNVGRLKDIATSIGRIDMIQLD